MVLSKEAHLVRSINIKCTKHDGSAVDPSVILIEENAGYTLRIDSANPQIFMVSNGALEIVDRENIVPVQEGFCFIVTPGRRTSLTFTEKCVVLRFDLRLDTQFCIHSTLPDLPNHYMPDEYPYYLLKINTALDIFRTGIIPFLKAELCCECYLQAETSKLFHILMGFYSRHEIAMFFSPIICEDIRFRGLILSRIDSATTVTQLHRMTMPEMHPARFRAKFQNIFGTNPHEYITNHKKKVVHSLIVTTGESFKVIAYDNGFSSQQVFIEFCKRHFGYPPQKNSSAKPPESEPESPLLQIVN